MEYPSCHIYPDLPDKGRRHRIFIGTKNDNPYIAKNSNASLSKAEQYSISVEDGDVIIEGFDEAGVPYGCVDFYNKYIVKFENTDTHPNMFCKVFDMDKLPDFSLVSGPSVQSRGIWTWGHVIYNYRNFIDNMVQLKLVKMGIEMEEDNNPEAVKDVL